MENAKVPGPTDNGAPENAPVTQACPQIPRAGLRKKRGMFWPNLIIISLVLVVGAFAAFHYTRQGERIEVWFNDIHGLRVGSPVELDGDQIGEIVEIGRPDNLSRRKVVIELIKDKAVVDRLRRAGNNFYVSRFSSDRLQLKGVTKVLRGPSIVVRLGDPAAAVQSEFDGKDGMPPDPRIVWNSVRVTVNFPNVFGLPVGAYVMDRGVEVGVVEKIASEPGSDTVQVTLAFFETDEKKCVYVREHTRYFINKAKLTPKGIEGDASTVLYGAYVTAIPDPCDADSIVKVTRTFNGETDAAPEILPRIGEKQMVLETRTWLPTDTPVFYRGELAGYVHSLRRSSDSNSLYVVVRIFPWAQPQVCQKTEFFMQSKLKAQLFKSRGLFDWEGPRFEIPDPQLLLRPAIEFRTPPESGRRFGFNVPERPSFTLHSEPKEEWLNWNSSIPIQEGNRATAPEPQVNFPRPVSAKFHWREAWKALVSWRKHEGMVMPVPGGVIGPANLLEPDVAEANIRKVTFEIAGKGRARDNLQYVQIGKDLRLMKMELEAEVTRCPKEQLGSIQAPVDVWIVTDPDNPRALASAKLTLSNDCLDVSADAGYQASWHGAPVICRDRTSPAFGKVIGIFIVGEKAKSARVALFPADVASKF